MEVFQIGFAAMSHTDLSLELSLAGARDGVIRHGKVHAGRRLRRRVALPIILALSLGLWMLVWQVATFGVAVLVGA